MHLDPVCRSVLSEEQVEVTFVYQDKTYSFCCNGCRDRFTADPEAYIGRNWWQRFLYRLSKSNAVEFKGKRPSCHG